MTLHTFTPAAALILTCGLTWLAQPCAAQRGSAPVRAQPTTARMATSYPFPARADELKPGEYWYRLKKTHGAGWKLGYDLDAIRHDSMEAGPATIRALIQRQNGGTPRTPTGSSTERGSTQLLMERCQAAGETLRRIPLLEAGTQAASPSLEKAITSGWNRVTV